MKESTRVLLALVAAILLRVLIAASQNASLIRAADAITPIGTLWVHGIRMTVIPLVVSLLITGVASVSDIKSIGRLGGRTLVTFVLLLLGIATIVIPVALAMFGLLPPHSALQLPSGALEAANEISAEGQAQTFSAWLVSLLPANPIAAVLTLSDGSLDRGQGLGQGSLDRVRAWVELLRSFNILLASQSGEWMCSGRRPTPMRRANNECKAGNYCRSLTKWEASRRSRTRARSRQFRLDALVGRGEFGAMNSLRSTLFILAALLLSASPFLAQEKPRVSPHETVNATVGDAKITIVYGRPYTKDPKGGEKRKIWGGLVPYGKVWRMGADEATLFTTDKEVSIGGTTVAPGTYSLYLWPEEGSAKLIINKQTGQWGTKYDESQDLVRIDLKKQTLEKPVDQFTIVVDKTEVDGVLKLMWENTQYSASITVKK